MRKRRMPEEKLAEIVSNVKFESGPPIWMPILEECFHQVLRYEYYMNKIPGNLALPKYRKIIVRIIYRLLSQVHPSRYIFSKSIQQPDPIIQDFMDYLVESEIQRKQNILNRNPLTQQTIRFFLEGLKNDLEI